MNSGTYEYQSEFVRKYVAQGEARGKAEGEVRGEAKSVLMFLEARHLVVTDEQKQKILSCTDLEVLDRWIRKAAVVSSTEELFLI